MLEYPEIQVISSQLRSTVVGKKILTVLPPTKLHKFCFFNGDAKDYDVAAKNAKINDAYPVGLFVEISLDNGQYFCFNDGVNARFVSSVDLPKDYQLAILFDDNTALVFTVAMYGGLFLHDGNMENTYYKTGRTATKILGEEFEKYFDLMFYKSPSKLSVKAFLATNQRFVGLGNGVLQDILFESNIHPKTKICDLSASERLKIKANIINVIKCMIQLGGRDTERDLYGNKGGYQTKMSALGQVRGCPVCGSEIKKEAYLGGSVYYCPKCQQQK